MAIRNSDSTSVIAGHTMGDFPKRTSQGNGKRKRGSYSSRQALPRPRSLITTPELPMKFLKALFEGFTAEAQKTCGKCQDCTCSQPKSNFYDRYCEENPWADQCKIYED